MSTNSRTMCAKSTSHPERNSVSDDKIERIPVTKEYMAVVISGRYSTGHKSEKCFADALYDSVAGMVYSLAKKYSCTCRDEIADLVNDCALRIFGKIHQFNPLKGAFTTWCWRVCSSVLARTYRKDKRYMERFSEYDKFDELIGDTGPIVLDGDVRQVVLGLFEQNPDKRKILVAMFGDPNDTLCVPDRICVSHISRDLGMEYNTVYSFLQRVVRPFFEQRLCMGSSRG